MEKKEEERPTVEDLIARFNDIIRIVEESYDEEFINGFLEHTSVLEFFDNNYIGFANVENYVKDGNTIKANLTLSVVPSDHYKSDSATVPVGVTWSDDIVIALKEEDTVVSMKEEGEVDGRKYAYDKIVMMDSSIVNISEFGAGIEPKKVIIFIDPDTEEYYVTKDGDLLVADIIDDYEFNDLSIVNKDYLASLIELEKRQMDADKEEETKEESSEKEAPEEIADAEEEVKAEE